MPLMGAVGSDIQLPTGLDSGARQTLGGALPVVAAALLVLALLIVWAVFIRKPAKRRERGRLLDKPKAPTVKSPPAEDASSKSSRRRRRRREQHRPRNPTLSETGGLPPLGTGDANNPPL